MSNLPGPNDSSSTKNSPDTEATKESVKSIALAIFALFAFRSSCFESFQIPSGSMIPTLLVGDRLFVNKFSYGFKLPFAEYLLDDPVYLWRADGPKRGEIVVFRGVRDDSIYLIKRIVGLPGDTIEVRDNHLFINQKEIVRFQPTDAALQVAKSDTDKENLGFGGLEFHGEEMGDKRPIILTAGGISPLANYGPTQVPADHYFGMGDNRDFSSDSRDWGYIPSRNIKGRAVVLWGTFAMSPTTGPMFFRFDRIGKLLN